jgi:hypothetical protein
MSPITHSRFPTSTNDVKTLSVSNVEIPIAYYNISANLGNNCLQIIGTSYAFGRHPGRPDTATSLNAKFLSLITTDISINVTQNGATQIVNKIGTNVTVNFNYSAVSSTDTVGTYDKFNTKFKLGWMLGLPQYILYACGNPTITSEAMLDLNGPRYLVTWW